MRTIHRKILQGQGPHEALCVQPRFVPARVEQGKHYECNGLDLVAPTPEQYDRYSDGSHQGKKKLEESEKAEAERKITEARTKAGEKAKKHEGASTSKKVNVAELMRRREKQVEIQNVGRIDAKKGKSC